MWTIGSISLYLNCVECARVDESAKFHNFQLSRRIFQYNKGIIWYTTMISHFSINSQPQHIGNRINLIDTFAFGSLQPQPATTVSNFARYVLYHGNKMKWRLSTLLIRSARKMETKINKIREYNFIATSHLEYKAQVRLRTIQDIRTHISFNTTNQKQMFS